MYSYKLYSIYIIAREDNTLVVCASPSSVLFGQTCCIPSGRFHLEALNEYALGKEHKLILKNQLWKSMPQKKLYVAVFTPFPSILQALRALRGPNLGPPPSPQPPSARPPPSPFPSSPSWSSSSSLAHSHPSRLVHPQHFQIEPLLQKRERGY